MTATLKTLAAELGITPAAVSMALRNHPRISEKTRSRAKALARKRGYIPSPAFRRSGAMRARKAQGAMPMALVLQDHPHGGLGISTHVETVGKVAAGFGYQLQVHHATGSDATRLGSVLYARGVEAVLLGRIFHKSFLTDFPWKHFSVVALDAGHWLPPCHTVLPDVACATVEAVRRVLRAGCRRVGIYEFREEVEPVDWVDRLGAVAAAKEICLVSRAKFFHKTAAPYDEAAFVGWLRDARPDAIIGQTPACYWWQKKHAVRGARVLSLSLQMDPVEKKDGLAGFVHDHHALATVAIKLLDSEVRNFERGKPPIPTRLLVTMPWNAGSRLRPRQTAA
ncbi:MAG: hypothetical protein Fur0032_05870 [Terrimicrobiaceae bacterium]